MLSLKYFQAFLYSLIAGASFYSVGNVFAVTASVTGVFAGRTIV